MSATRFREHVTRRRLGIGLRGALAGTAGWVFIIATLSGYPAMAAAEEYTSSSLIEEVVVTARKRSERLQDVPASATALNSGFMEDVGGVYSLRDITDLVAGISINETQEPMLTEPTIRGAGQSRNRASVSATGLYRNGAYFATNSLGGKNFARMDTYDLDRVEVLRGPQGALYGRNALGGSINLISQRPTDQMEFDFYVAAGDLDLKRGDIKANIPLGEKFAVRAGHFYEKRDDGFYADINGDDVDPQRFEQTRIALRYQPTENLDINYMFDTQDEESTPSFRVVTARTPDLSDAFETTINTAHSTDADVDNHNLVLDWTLGSGVLTSVSNYRTRDIEMWSDSDYSAQNPVLIDHLRETVQTVDNDIFFQEVRYVADATDNINWLVGADYFTQDNTEVIDAWQGELWANAQYRNVNMSSDSWAVFGLLEYSFDSIPLSITGELRYAEDRIDGDVVTYRANAQPGVPDTSNPVNPQTEFATDDKYTNLPWAITAAYHFEGPDLMTYAKVATSYRHGGMNLNEGSPGLELYPAVLTYGEETSITYELGVKSTWFDRALTVNAAVYLTDYEDFLDTTTNGCPDQCQLVDEDGIGLGFNPDGTKVGADVDGFPIPPNETIPTAFFIDNVGKASAWGFEIEGTYRAQFDFGGTLLLNLGYSHGEGEVKSLNDDVSESTRATGDGAKLPYLRPNQVKGSVVYRQTLSGLNSVPLFAGATLVGAATYAYEEGGYGNLNVNDPRDLDTVKRLSAHIGLETNSWSLFVRGENLTDYAYKTEDRVSWYIRNTPRFVYGEFTLRLRP